MLQWFVIINLDGFEVFYLIIMTCIVTYCSFNTFIHNFYKNPKCHENVKKYC